MKVQIVSHSIFMNGQKLITPQSIYGEFGLLKHKISWCVMAGSI